MFGSWSQRQSLKALDRYNQWERNTTKCSVWVKNSFLLENYTGIGIPTVCTASSIIGHLFQHFPYTLVCHCRHKVVQVQTSLIEPSQVGEKRLQLLHKMVPHGLFRETLMEEPGLVYYFPLRAKTFQTIDIYLTSGCGQLLSFQGGIINVTLYFRRRVRWAIVFILC